MPTRTGKRARRARGQGTVVHRKDGRWAAVVPMANGERVSRYAKTEAEAELVRQQLAAGRDGLAIPVGIPSLGAFLEQWLAHRESLGCRPRTLEQYRLAAASATAFMGGTRVADLKKLDVDQWLRSVGTRLSPRTVNHYRSALRNALNVAMGWELATTNAAKASDRPDIPWREQGYVTAAEARAVIEASRDHRLHALIVLACFTGMRLSELLGLTWTDIDMDGATLTVRRQAARYGGEWTFPPVKTRRGFRVVVLAPDAVEALRRHRVRQAEERLAMGHGGHYEKLVFTTGTGMPLHRTTVNKIWHVQLDRAGVRSLPFHAARHGYATLQLEAGLPARVVQEQLGHANVNVTLSIYSHVRPEMSRQAADRIQEALGKSS